MSILKARGISKIYNGSNRYSVTEALKQVDLEIEEGSFTSIMGPSGSGKTSLLNVLSGLGTATSGEIIIKDRELFNLTKDELAVFRRQHLGFIFQDYNLLDGLTVEENIMLPMILEKGEVTKMKEKAEQLMRLFSIEDIAHKLPHQISGGQQQRCAIARALINQTDIIFADEPTGNLDSKSAKAVMRALERANTENEITILMVTHDPYTASYGNRVIFIKDGRIEAELYRKASQKEFFHNIMDNLAVLEGGSGEI